VGELAVNYPWELLRVIGRDVVPKYSLTGLPNSLKIAASWKQTTHSEIEGELI